MEITVENLRILLGWCSAINTVILLVWFLAFVYARDQIFQMLTNGLSYLKNALMKFTLL